jgi:1-acyl-sn-glycerol-3-phosphate acyltransferase
VNANLIPHRSRLFLFFFPLTSYLVTNLTVAAGWVFFKILNRTLVFGRENIGERPNTVLLANHLSMIDGFLVGFGAFFPKSLWKPGLMPWHPAAYENFFAHPVMAWFSDNWKCIPVKPGRKDFGAMKRMERALHSGLMTVFPEGTRSRDGKLLPPRSGIGFVMLRTHPRAIPICLEGVDDVLPVGKLFPRIFGTMMIHYGKPVDLSDVYALEPTRENAQICIQKVFASIRRQQALLKRYRRYRAHLLSKMPFYFRFYRP